MTVPVNLVIKITIKSQLSFCLFCVWHDIDPKLLKISKTEKVGKGADLMKTVIQRKRGEVLSFQLRLSFYLAKEFDDCC